MGAVGDVSAGYAQLLRVVGCLINEVRSLKDCKVTACTDRVVSDKQQEELSRDVNLSRDTIFNEVREVTKREKRKYCIMLKGFDCNSVNDICEKFKEVCQILNVGSVDLSDVKIGDTKSFRAKVLNAEKRNSLLMVIGRLRTIYSFENVYIQNDLTYRQRQELSEKRRKSRLSIVGDDDKSRDKFFPPLVKPRPAVSESATSSSGSGKHEGRERGRGFSRRDVLGHNQSQMPTSVGRDVYGSIPQVSRRSLN